MFWDFMSQVYRLPIMIFKRAMMNPMGILVYGILSKWYTMVMIAAIIVTYWVFKGLKDAGVIDKINVQLTDGFDQAQSVAQHCTPLILNIDKLWNCVQNPPKYIPSADDKALIDGINQDMNQNSDIAASGSWDRSQQPNAGTQAPQPTNPYDN